MSALYDIPVTENRLLCKEELEFVRWKRIHHRPRIQKKWRRFGAIMRPGTCKGHGYQMHGVGIVGCPHFVEQLRAAPFGGRGE